MKLLFKEYFQQMNESPHKTINAVSTNPFNFDYQIEYFNDFKTEEQRLKKFQELKEYIGNLTLGADNLVSDPYNEENVQFFSNDETAKIARDTFKYDEEIQFHLLNSFGPLISKSIKPQRLPVTKRDDIEILHYQDWVDSIISEYQSIVFTENNKKF